MDRLHVYLHFSYVHVHAHVSGHFDAWSLRPAPFTASISGSPEEAEKAGQQVLARYKRWWRKRDMPRCHGFFKRYMYTANFMIKHMYIYVVTNPHLPCQSEHRQALTKFDCIHFLACEVLLILSYESTTCWVPPTWKGTKGWRRVSWNISCLRPLPFIRLCIIMTSRMQFDIMGKIHRISLNLKANVQVKKEKKFIWP